MAGPKTRIGLTIQNLMATLSIDITQLPCTGYYLVRRHALCLGFLYISIEVSLYYPAAHCAYDKYLQLCIEKEARLVSRGFAALKVVSNSMIFLLAKLQNKQAKRWIEERQEDSGRFTCLQALPQNLKKILQRYLADMTCMSPQRKTMISFNSAFLHDMISFHPPTIFNPRKEKTN